MGQKVSSPPLYREVREIQKYARLPVWPAWNGVFLWLVGKIFGLERAAQLENVMTGRVCPNFFQDTDSTSPFIMLVHHCHTFSPIDPLRFIQKLFFPEGFPSHPHRGFVTLTYFLDGGFRHRDSLGIEQVYGQNLEGVQHHSQWLSTGAGLLHEEMFFQKNWWDWQRQELYQLWINLPSKDKMGDPYLLLLGDNEETPFIEESGMTCRVLAGQYDEEHKAKVPTATDLSVLHVALKPSNKWIYPVPNSYETVIIYVRTGSVSAAGNHNDNADMLIPTHYTAFFSSNGRYLQLVAGQSGADFMVLAGARIKEPVAAQGSMVMNTSEEINRAYRDYQIGAFGRPWPHELSREEWRSHVRANPSSYRAASLLVDGPDSSSPQSP